MTYSFVTLYSLNKYFAETLQVVRSILTEPTFPERELGLVLEKNKQLFAVNSNKVENLARRALNTTLFGTAHPCGRFAEAADYDRITAETLRQYHRRYYHAHNCTLYLSGCVTDEIVAQVTDQLGSDYWGNGAEEALLLPAVPQTEKEKRITIPRADAVQNSINMGMLTVDSAHADFHKLRILITLFGGYFGSRLSSNIREEKGYTYGIGAQFVAYPNCNLLRIATEAAPDYTEAIIREVYHEIDRLHSELIPEDELHKVCQYMLGESSRSYEGPFSLADAFVHLQVMNLPHTYLQDAQQALFQTTSQELRRLAQQYLQPSYLKEVVAGSV